MSIPSREIAAAVTQILRGQAGGPAVGGWDQAGWAELERSGFADLLDSTDASNGADDSAAADLCALAEAIGAAGVSMPVIETAVARRALQILGSGPPGQLSASVQVRPGSVRAGRVYGTLRQVAWAPIAERLVVLDRHGRAGVVALAACELRSDRTVADEPAADVTLPPQGVVLEAIEPPLAALLSLAYSARTLAAARAVLDLSVRYARDRHQFGKPIIAFQAVGHQLAQLSGAVEMLDAMLERASVQFGDADPAGSAVRAARLCAVDASSVAVRVGHQVHGAIGVTTEYGLQRLTRRLLAWSMQTGWPDDALDLGRSVHGSDLLWNLLTATPQRPRVGSGTE